MVVEDNVVSFPALMTAGCPFVRIVSCNPLEIRGDDIPPPYSGLPTGVHTDWGAFRAEYDRTHRPLWAEFNTWVQEQGAPALPELEFMHTSRDLNLYVYPEAIDYVDRRPLDSTWQRLDSSVRDTDPSSFSLNGLDDGSGGLVYLSLGSLGSADVDLMRRLIEMLVDHAAPIHRVDGALSRRARARGQHGRAPSSCRRRRSCPWSTS